MTENNLASEIHLPPWPTPTRWHRFHTRIAQIYYECVMVPKMMKGTLVGIHVESVNPVEIKR